MRDSGRKEVCSRVTSATTLKHPLKIVFQILFCCICLLEILKKISMDLHSFTCFCLIVDRITFCFTSKCSNKYLASHAPHSLFLSLPPSLSLSPLNSPSLCSFTFMRLPRNSNLLTSHFYIIYIALLHIGVDFTIEVD